MPQVSILDHRVAYDHEDPDGYRAGVANLGAQLGARETALKMFELPPGQSLCPYHYEYVEEWMFVLSGELVVRTPDGEHGAPAGVLACFPCGPDGAHKVMNRSEQTARVLMFSSSREPAVSVYPDSDKIGVWPGDERDKVMLHRADGQVPYFEGER